MGRFQAGICKMYCVAIIAGDYSESEKVRDAQSPGAGAYLRKSYTDREMGEAVLNEIRSQNNG